MQAAACVNVSTLFIRNIDMKYMVVFVVYPNSEFPNSYYAKAGS